jgi:hypothetical protein
MEREDASLPKKVAPAAESKECGKLALPSKGDPTMTLLRATSAALVLALAIGAPVAAPAAGMGKMKMMKSLHQCRDAKGHFIKGKYVKCPAGTHKA